MLRPLALIAAMAAVAPSAFAASVSYTVQPALSVLAVSGDTNGSPFLPQTVNSNTTSFNGTIAADRTGATLTFTGGSNVDANPQASNQQPRADGTPGSATADYGFVVNLGFLGNVLVAGRGIAFDINSGALSVGTGGTLSGGSTLTFSNGELDYNSGVLFGEVDLFGESGPNVAPAAATLTTAGGVETLTLPISATYTTSIVQSDDTTLTVTGMLVATRNVAVPEPTTLAAAASVGLALVGRRRRQA